MKQSDIANTFLFPEYVVGSYEVTLSIGSPTTYSPCGALLILLDHSLRNTCTYIAILAVFVIVTHNLASKIIAELFREPFHVQDELRLHCRDKSVPLFSVLIRYDQLQNT